MQSEQDNGVLWWAAARASERPYFLAHDLKTYRTLQQWGDAELAACLGCPLATLPKLALCRRPDTQSHRFQEDVKAIAAFAGLDPVPLVRILREVDAFAALRVPETLPDMDRASGYLMAARDKGGESALDDAKDDASPSGSSNRGQP